MPTAVRWKVKPLLLLVALAMFMLLAVLKLYSQNMFVGSSKVLSNGHINNKQTDYIKWDEPSGSFNPSDPGEGGKPVVTKSYEESLKNEAYAQYGFNQFISDKISLHRSLSDPRPKQYKISFRYYIYASYPLKSSHGIIIISHSREPSLIGSIRTD